MRNKYFILSLMLICLGCTNKDIPVLDSDECLFLGEYTTNSVLGKIFYYDSRKKLIVRASAINTVSVSDNLRLDTIVYQKNGDVLTYRHRGLIGIFFSMFTVDSIPAKGLLLNTTEYIHNDKKIIKINHFENLNRLIAQDSLVYVGDKLVRIYSKGAKEIPIISSFYNTNTIKEIDYEGDNIKTVISKTFDKDNNWVGGDTILFYPNVKYKNPEKKLTYLPDKLIYSLSSNAYDSVLISYFYSMPSVGLSAGRNLYIGGLEGDNGKGYPKNQYWTYKCD